VVTVTTVVLVQRFLIDYVRNRANLLFLAVVPVVFVTVAADTMADAASALGGAGGGLAFETVTAGWTAGFLAAIAMYFQVSAAAKTDRRLVLSGLSSMRLVTARLTAGAVLAAVASAAALVALAATTGIQDPGRATVGTLMFAVVYLAFGAIVGAAVPNAVNGTVILLFIWIVDVFFGPALSTADSLIARFLPTHFLSLWTIDQPSGHGGLDELAASILWTAVAVVVAFLVLAKTSAIGHRQHSGSGHVSTLGQLRTGLKMGWHDWRRTPVLWTLLAVVPAIFILLADLTTPSGITAITVREGGVQLINMVDPADIHAGTMTPMAIGSLAALAGIFIVLDARSADQRLAVAGQPVSVVLATRLGMVMAAAAVATGVSLVVTATVFTPRQWGVYILANVLIAVTYAMIGVLLGPVFGKVSGVFMAFLIPFLDLGIGQSQMASGEPPTWAHYLPGYGGTRILVDGAVTESFDEFGSLILASGWIGLLGVAAVLLFRRTAGSSPSGRPVKAHAASIGAS
jgi:hypothetical protein